MPGRDRDVPAEPRQPRPTAPPGHGRAPGADPRAAMQVFGSKGYRQGSLAEVAEQVGITHAGVLHHFGSKEQLLIEVLAYRDKEDVRDLEGQHIPGGIELFHHLIVTAALNVERRGIVQGYTVLTGESVTDDHPARDWVTHRFTVLRGEIATALRVALAERRADVDGAGERRSIPIRRWSPARSSP